MAEIKVQYNGSTATYTAPLQTKGKFMVDDLGITAEPTLRSGVVVTPTRSTQTIGYTGYDGLATVTVEAISEAQVDNQDMSVTLTQQTDTFSKTESSKTGIGSITVTAATVTPTFTGGNITFSPATIDVDEMARDPENLPYWDENIDMVGLGIPLKVKSYVHVSSDAVTYSNNVNGWVNKSSGDTAFNGQATSDYVSDYLAIKGVFLDPNVYSDPFKVGLNYGGTVQVEGFDMDGTIHEDLVTVSDNSIVTEGPMMVSLEGMGITDNTGHIRSIPNFPTPTITQTPVTGGVQVTASVALATDAFTPMYISYWVDDVLTPIEATVTIPTGSTINNQDIDTTQTSQTYTYTADSGYTGIGSITVTAQTANPAFDGGDITYTITAGNITQGNMTSSISDTSSGILFEPTINGTISRASVLYNGAVNGWVNKLDDAQALASSSIALSNIPLERRYITSVSLGANRQLTVNQVGTNATLTVAKPLNSGSVNINGTGSGSVVASGSKGVTVDEVTVTDSNWDLITASPAFTGGDAYADASFSHTETNVTTTDTDTGIYIQPDVSVNYSRASVLYSGAVNGWVNKANNAVAMEAETYMPEMGIYEPIYISGVTVPSGTTFNVTNNGTTNINGGLADKGVQVKANKEVVVDNMTNFPVTYATTTVVNGITYSAGDLKVPVYSPTSTSIQFPSGFATATTTSTVTLSGNITTINGLTIKDPLAVTGSGTAPGTNYFYMPKISSTRVLSNGPKVTIDTSTPTGGSNGDIWFQKMV